jgi:hypothetical protein
MLEILSHFDAPSLPQPSTVLARAYPRFGDVARAHLYAEALADPAAPLPPGAASLPIEDRRALEIAREVPAHRTPSAWQGWFSALFSVSKPMIPNGGGATLERFLRSARVTEALALAPPEVRAQVEFLSLAGKRDLEGIRRLGPSLLDGPMQSQDPVFRAYVFVTTTSACLAGNPDASCRRIIAMLDLVPRGSPVIDVLRAHQSALR